MEWILQENICQEEQWSDLVDRLKRRNIKHSVHKVVPFVGDLIPEPNISDNTKVWCMGSTAMQNVCRQNNWTPGVIDVPDVSECITRYGSKYLNHDCIIAPLKIWACQEKTTTNELHFVRPANDSKFIAGQLMKRNDLIDWAHRVVNLGENDGSNVNRNSELVVGPPKSIQQEVRFWIVDGQIATYSLYKLGRTVTYSRSLVDNDFIWFAKSATSPMTTRFNGWEPAKAYCLDLCRDENDEIKIVEINNINSSGLYDCDVDKLVTAIEGYFNRIS